MFEDYYICFFDLMGQKEFFAAITSDVLGKGIGHDVERVTSGIKEMVKYVNNRYSKWFSVEDKAGIEIFSDSLLIYVKNSEAVARKIGLWLGMLVKLIFIACRYKLPVRGGITLGRAYRSEHGSIYGLAVEEAMELESEYADYPRIVLANKLDKLVAENDIWRKFFRHDVDSSMILNYACRKLLSQPEFQRERVSLVEIEQWVEEQYKHFCFWGDDEHDKYACPKLARRYVMWLDYLSRISRT